MDEFQSFVAAETFDSILSEARKYRLCLVLAHQYVGQLDDKLRRAVFGNVGTTIVFPVGPENGESLEKHFYPDFNRQDLVDHAKHHIYLKLAIDGKTSKPFSAWTLQPFHGFEPQGTREMVVRNSQEKHATKKGIKEQEVKRPYPTESPNSHPGQRTLI